MDLMTRVWLRRLFWALLALAATYALAGISSRDVCTRGDISVGSRERGGYIKWPRGSK